MSAPVIYEVNIEVEPSIEQAFLQWLKKHIQDMESIDGFQKGTRVFREQTQATALSVHYFLDSEAVMDTYLREHAERMRGDLPEDFKNHLQFRRRILLPDAAF